MRNIKNIYTKAHFSEQAFAQMLHKDIRNLYKNIISFLSNKSINNGNICYIFVLRFDYRCLNYSR